MTDMLVSPLTNAELRRQREGRRGASSRRVQSGSSSHGSSVSGSLATSATPGRCATNSDRPSGARTGARRTTTGSLPTRQAVERADRRREPAATTRRIDLRQQEREQTLAIGIAGERGEVLRRGQRRERRGIGKVPLWAKTKRPRRNR